VEQNPVKDPITTELEKIVANRAQQLQLYEELVKNSTAPLNAVDAAKYDLAKAQIDLLQRREELGRKAGNQELEGLTSKLAELSLQTMQTQSRIGGLEEAVRRAQALLPDADAYERRSIRAEVAKRVLAAAVVRLDRAEQRLRLMETPSVTTVGGD
jgi:DNA-directed RNA polymerase subunit K/omega